MNGKRLTIPATTRGPSLRYPKINHSLVVVMPFLLSALFCAAQVSEKKASYLTIEVPGALGTYPMAINNSPAARSSFPIDPEVTGYYLVSPTVANAFVRYGDGVMFTFSAPGAAWTEPESMNAAGDITGFYEVPGGGDPHGFVRYAKYGAIITFDTPFLTPIRQTLPIGINEFGEIAGNFVSSQNGSYGFTRSTVGAAIAGVFTDFGYGTGSTPPTFVTGLNASGTIVGYFFEDQGPNESSFILHPDGLWTPFVVPPNQESSCSQTTLAESINAAGTIAGFYSGYSGTDANMCATVDAGGFVRSPQGVFTLFNAPGPMVTSPLRALPADGATLSAPSRLNINQAGTTTGSYTDAKGAQHGFVREPDGVITSFDPPRGMQTTATGINDSGLIVGSFLYDWNPQTSIGFLRIPIP
jgi:hypothetical protein